MNPNDYSEEQKTDIEARVASARKSLDELKLQPAVMMQPVNIGDDVFALKPIPYLQDTKYTSPIKKSQV